jgi:hypothetical protein
MAWEMSSATGISIAALLDHMSENKQVADNQTEEQKEKGKLVCPSLADSQSLTTDPNIQI